MKYVKKAKYLYTIEYLNQLIEQGNSLKECVLQALDFSQTNIQWENIELAGSVFLGCSFKSLEDELVVRKRGAYIFPKFDDIPYNPFRSELYTWQELMEGYDPQDDQSCDLRIYRHFVKTGAYNPDIKEALAQRIHDHAIDDAVRCLLQYDKQNMTKIKAVGFMGGHRALRGGEDYCRVAKTARLVAREGYLVVSGGGPGIMEASNLGAYMSERSVDKLDDAIKILAEATDFTQPEYIRQAQIVLDKYPDGCENLAIPTWFYGHEPSNQFASAIAKYFSNSIREDNLLAICLYGIVYARGSAGTTQEIFQDATQNHYGTFGYYSPMVFLGKDRYLQNTSIYPLIEQLADGSQYAEMLSLTDSPQEVVDFIKNHPPVKNKMT